MTSAAINEGIKLIKEFEGLELKAYPDPGTGGAPWTIGWGNTRYLDGFPVRAGQTITAAQADTLLLDTLTRQVIPALERVPFWKEMSPKQQGALMSFAWNLGWGFYGQEGFRTISTRLKDRAWQLVPEALLLYRNPGTSVEAGLRRRREAEGKLWREGLAQQSIPSKPASRLITIPSADGPKKSPYDFGFKQGDSHILVNDINETARAFSFEGKPLWTIPCLARGQGSDNEYRFRSTDTPPGLYRIGEIYKDYERAGSTPAFDRTLLAYGWYSFDLVELENQEAKHGRAGIMIHGGGSACGWPGAWAPKQSLFPTLGCVRLHNIDLRDKVLPLTKTGTVFVSVFQELLR